MNDMKCPNCNEEVEVVRTRVQKKGRAGLYVTEHPDNACPGFYHYRAFFDTEKQCKDAYKRFKDDMLKRN